MKDTLRIVSSFPKKAKRYLKAVVDNNKELEIFLNDFLPMHENIFIAIAEFRMNKLNEREEIPFDSFCKEFYIDDEKAISQLFLYPKDDLVKKTLIKKIHDGEVTLEDVYTFQQKNPIFNPILVGKQL